MPTQVIIADDLTGAMDTGVLFARKYPRVSVLFDKNFIDEMARQNDALIIDTESRNIPSENAYSIVREYVESLSDTGSELIYKKIDSTLRGNIGRELEAILDTGAFDMIALAPALTLNGRTTLNGCHYLNGRLLTESDLASDPFSPVKSSYIPDIVKGQTVLNTSVVSLKDIRAGNGFLSEVLNNLHINGCRIAVMDAETEGDLDNIVKALGVSKLKVLPCGSAGLFSRMFAAGESDNRTYTEESGMDNCRQSHIKKDKPLVVLSGSPAKISKLQIAYAQNNGEYVVKLDGDRIIATEAMASAEINRVKNLALQTLGTGGNIIIDAAGAGKNDLNEAFSGRPEKLLEASRKLQNAIACIAEEIAGNAEISGMLIFGGDTALSICRRLGAKALRIMGEVEPLVPYGTFVGGRLNGMYVATKAGGFGSESIIPNTVRYFR